MALDFVCGWECRQAIQGSAPVPADRHWDSISGAPAISTTTVRTGTAALRIAAAAASRNIQKDVARTIVAGRFYIHWATLPAIAANIPNFMRCINASGNMDISVSNVGAVTAIIGAGSRSATIATVTTGVWYRIDFLADASTGTATLKVRVDGGTEQTASNVQASANVTGVKMGTDSSTQTFDGFYDDLVLGTATGDYPIGEGSVVRLKPNADGTHSFTAGDFAYDVAGGNVSTSATDVNTFVDDDDLTTTAELIRQAVIRSTGYVEVLFADTPIGQNALAVSVVASFHASTTGADTCGLSFSSDNFTTTRECLDDAGDNLMDVSQTTVMIVEDPVLMLTPPEGGTWTKAKIDNIKVRWGFSTDVIGIPYWDGVMLEVAYADTRVPYVNRMPQMLAH